MGKILVTGASGDIGKKTLLHLLKLKPANELIGLARDPSKAADLAAKGIEIRQGDYYDRDSLSKAFQGVEKLMLTSTHAFTDRKTAHANVIDVAAETGVRHLVYMPIYHKAGSTFTMKEITEEDIFSIDKLRSSAWPIRSYSTRRSWSLPLCMPGRTPWKQVFGCRQARRVEFWADRCRKTRSGQRNFPA